MIEETSRGTEHPVKVPVQNKSKIKPVILSVVFAFAAFFVSTFWIFAPTGVPPSSTAGLALLFITPAAIISGIIGYFVGKSPVIDKPKVFYAVILLVIVLVLLLVIAILFDPLRKAYEEANNYGIKTDAGVVNKLDLKNIKFLNHEVLLECSSLYIEVTPDTGDMKREFDWGGNKTVFSVSHVEFWDYYNYSIRDTVTGKTIENSLKNYDYINSISLFPYEKDGESYLFVLVNLRPTSKRTLLIVYKHPGEKVFEELIDRTDLSLPLILGFGKSEKEGDVITISDYIGDFNNYTSDYELCKLGRIEKNDFKLLDYGYQISP